VSTPWVVPVTSGDLTIPPYREVQFGRWRIRQMADHTDMEFWDHASARRSITFLEGPAASSDVTMNWMSTLSMELESQEIGIAGAVGTTVILGLGLGWALLNTALRPSVDRVVVVERDPETIGLAEVSGLFDTVAPAVRAKVEIVEADAFSYSPDGPVDTLLADIWPDWQHPEVVSDMRRLHAGIGGERVHFWGQEIAIWRSAVARFGPTAPFDWPAIRRTVSEDMALPLILPDWPDYPDKILKILRRFSYSELIESGIELS
jgi:hypothetical protein